MLAGSCSPPSPLRAWFLVASFAAPCLVCGRFLRLVRGRLLRLVPGRLFRRSMLAGSCSPPSPLRAWFVVASFAWFLVASFAAPCLVRGRFLCLVRGRLLRRSMLAGSCSPPSPLRACWFLFASFAVLLRCDSCSGSPTSPNPVAPVCWMDLLLLDLVLLVWICSCFCWICSCFSCCRCDLSHGSWSKPWR
jgi:hypothetical protein